MYRLGERVRLDLPEPYQTATVEVDRVVSQNVAAGAIALASAFEAAEAQMEALAALFAYVISEARPTWDLVEPRGAVPVTPSGFLRLPTDLAFAIFEGWLDTLTKKVSDGG
jgi:hypothetical protein